MPRKETHFENANEVHWRIFQEFAEPDSASDPDDEGFEEYHEGGDQQGLSTGTSKSTEATSVESSDKASKSKHRSRKKRALSPLLDLLDVAPAVSKNFSPNGEFERLAGTPCPFKLGQVVKFPNCNLSTLRISDVTLHRLIDLLDLVDRHRVLVTFHRMIKAISERELARGYDFTIDKKSLVKCLKALESVHLITMFDTLVVAESVENKVRIVCHRDIHSADDPEVIQVIQATVDEYHKEGRVFPHGQLR
ncbi:unnamed protein product [Cylicostephanus goldi]|uniref:GTF3C1 extended winged-helix domain-containing protein n=1 Tax=Cylicostephanus goldi TaxID=71465 RepID=A0A3P7PK38_CYLGO|nr:unnamed protein product [Cylicostephanus goldi]